MGKSSGFFLNKTEILWFTSLTIFLGLPKNKVGMDIKSIHICHLRVLMGYSAESEINLLLGNFLNLKLNTRLPIKKDTKIRR